MRRQAIVPWPTTRSPSSRHASWPGAGLLAGSASSIVASPPAPSLTPQGLTGEW